MRRQYHYRPVQHVLLAVLAALWLVLLPLAFAGQAVAAGTDWAARGITTAQLHVLTHPVYQSPRPEQRVWRVR